MFSCVFVWVSVLLVMVCFSGSLPRTKKAGNVDICGNTEGATFVSVVSDNYSFLFTFLHIIWSLPCLPQLLFSGFDSHLFIILLLPVIFCFSVFPTLIMRLGL